MEGAPTSAPIQMRVRLPAALKAWIGRQAVANRRSMNGEIVFRLEAAMAAEGAELPAEKAGEPATGTRS